MYDVSLKHLEDTIWVTPDICSSDQAKNDKNPAKPPSEEHTILPLLRPLAENIVVGPDRTPHPPLHHDQRAWEDVRLSGAVGVWSDSLAIG